MTDTKTDHWQTLYQTKSPTDVSWFRPQLEVSLELMSLAGLNEKSRVIDIGAGASTLADDVLDRGVRDITALDISATSLNIAKQRLGAHAQKIRWIVADAARHSFASDRFDIWHDRAALHFLDPNDAAAYVAKATAAIAAGGHAIIGCFARNGPETCSGLPVARRDPEDIQKLFGSHFALVASRTEQHITPARAAQRFAYALLKKVKLSW